MNYLKTTYSKLAHSYKHCIKLFTRSITSLENFIFQENYIYISHIFLNTNIQYMFFKDCCKAKAIWRCNFQSTDHRDTITLKNK